MTTALDCLSVCFGWVGEPVPGQHISKVHNTITSEIGNFIVCVSSTSVQIHTLLIIFTDPAVTASMSSTWGCARGFCFPASKAIDGVYVPVITAATLDYESIAHTGAQQSPYIQLDLGTNRCIRGVKIWNRSNDPNCKHHYFIIACNGW